MSYNGSGTFLINTAGQPVVSGTVISSTAFNALTADLATGLSTAITKDGQTTVTANIPMGTYKFTGLGAGTAATDSANLSQVQSTVTKLLASVSGADTITAVGSPTLGAYAAGQMFYFIAAGDNTGAVTLNIDSLGAKAVTRDGTTALAAGDIQSGEVCVVVYDGTRFQLVNGASQSASIVTENLTVNKATVLNESGGDNDTRIEGDTDANLFFADASTDRIGIGTSSPSQKLDASVASTTQGSGFGVTNSQAGGYGSGVTFYSFRSDGTTKLAAAQIYAEGAQSWADAGNTASNLVFKTVDNNTLATRMHISSGGNVGIGTTSPSLRVDVQKSDGSGRQDLLRVLAGGNATGNGASIALGSTQTQSGYITGLQTASTEGALVFGTQSSGAYAERARITSGGDFGIGTTSPQAYTNYTVLTVDNATNGGVVSVRRNGNALLNLYTGSGEGRVEAANSAFLSFYTTSAERARITADGNLLVGKTDTSYDVNGIALLPAQARLTAADGNPLLILRNGSNGTVADFWRGGIGIVGSISITTTGTAYNTSSDYRLKEDQQPLSGSGAFIDALQPKIWKWKNDGSKGVGLIAHEVQEISPSSVIGEKDAVDSDGKPVYQAMEYGSAEFIANIIAELQSLRKRVAELEAK